MMSDDIERGNGKVGQGDNASDPEDSFVKGTSRSMVVEEKTTGPLSLTKRYENFILQLRGNPSTSPDAVRPPTFFQMLAAEVVGTGMYCFFGLAVTSAALVAGSTSGIFQVVIIWAIAVTLAIISTISISGAHLNPAITLTFALLRPDHFPIRRLPAYWAAQLLGGIAGAGLNYAFYKKAITQFEAYAGITRGQPGSELTGFLFNGMYPNPATVYEEAFWTQETVSTGEAFAIEAFGTGFLAYIVFVVADPRNQLRLGGGAIAYTIGMAVLLLGCIFGPLEQMGINPARDLGPRFLAYGLGWDTLAFPGMKKNVWVYLIAPLVGGPLGGALHDFVLTRGM